MVSKRLLCIGVYVCVYVVYTEETIIVEEPKRTNLPPNFHPSWPFSFLTHALVPLCYFAIPSNPNKQINKPKTITSKEGWMNAFRIADSATSVIKCKKRKEIKEKNDCLCTNLFFCPPCENECLVEGNFFFCFLSGEVGWKRRERRKLALILLSCVMCWRSVNYIYGNDKARAQKWRWAGVRAKRKKNQIGEAQQGKKEVGRRYRDEVRGREDRDEGRGIVR